MQRILRVLMVAALCSACNDESAREVQRRIKAEDVSIEQMRARTVEMQESDIQGCRDRGGLPITAPSDVAPKTRRMLTRCELPCVPVAVPPVAVPSKVEK